MTIDEYLSNPKAIEDFGRWTHLDSPWQVHAQRLRTGRLIPYVRVPFVEFAEIGPAGLICAISDKTDGTLRSPDSWIYQGVLPTVVSTDLPRAICAVLLAAHRVANLNPGGSS